MATTEENPIFVISEDESADDFDDVVVVKTEPPVEDNDVIFVSETRIIDKDNDVVLEPDKNAENSSSVTVDAGVDAVTVDSSCEITDATSSGGTTTPSTSDEDLNKVLEDMIGNGLDTGISQYMSCCCYTTPINLNLDKTLPAPGTSQHNAEDNKSAILQQANRATSLTCQHLDNAINLSNEGIPTSLSTNGASTDLATQQMLVNSVDGDVMKNNTGVVHNLVIPDDQSQTNKLNTDSKDDAFQQIEHYMKFLVGGVNLDKTVAGLGRQNDATLGNLRHVQTIPDQLENIPTNSPKITDINQSNNMCMFSTNSSSQKPNVTSTVLPQSTSSSNMIATNHGVDMNNEDKLFNFILDMTSQSTSLPVPSLSRNTALSLESMPPRKRYKFTNSMFESNVFENELQQTETVFCVKCVKSDFKITTFCTKGHQFCDSCIKELATQVLLEKTKCLMCPEESCHGTYSIGELKKTLPEMVIDILEKREIENIAEGITWNNRQKDESQDLPEGWSPIEARTTLKIVVLENDSIEFLNVAIRYFETMDGDKCCIHRISRIQNLTLLKYYNLKKIEMVHENDGLEVQEERLFHGTQGHCVEAIIRKGFDWRVCGKHGTLYGEGCYFAKNAVYSHDYTDFHNYKHQKSNRKNRRYQRKQNNFGPPPAHSQSPYFSSPNINSNLAHQNYPPPAHQLLLGSSSTTSIQSLLNPGLSSGLVPTINLMPLALYQNQLSNSTSVAYNLNSPPTPRCMPTRGNMAPNNPMEITENVKKDPENLLNMFLSRVLVGKSTGGQKGFRKPPPLFPEFDRMGRCYDSCVDNIFDPKIWVVFDSHQSYPEYLVEYTTSDLLDY